MEPAHGDGWRNEIRKYWCKIEEQTKLSLELIKRNRIENGLPFDDKFKANFLKSAYEKISDSFKPFLSDEQKSETNGVNDQSYTEHHLLSNSKPNEMVRVSTQTLQDTVAQTNAPTSQMDPTNHTQQVEDIDQNDDDDERIEEQDELLDEEWLSDQEDNEEEEEEEEEKVMNHPENYTTIGIEIVADTSQLQNRIISTASDSDYLTGNSNGDYSTNIEQYLELHNRTHMIEQPYQCGFYDKRFTHLEQINNHMKIHRNLFRFECLKCRKGFSIETECKFHESRCEIKIFECYLCKMVLLKNKRHLTDHMREHTGEKLRCYNGYLKNERKLASGAAKMKRYRCEYCGYSTNDRKYSQCHNRIHTNVRPYQCKFCDTRFTHPKHLNHHMKKHGDLFPFECLNCRRGFSYETDWKSHEGHCNARQFECYICNKKFRQNKAHLARHMRYKHTGEWLFSCSGCPRRFCEKSKLTEHLKFNH